MITYDQIFNNVTLNIFTDASISNRAFGSIGAPGYIAVIGENVIDEKIQILGDSTNNESEIYAVHMAIQYALANRYKAKSINIFSDSQFAIYGLREWIFKWMNHITDDKLYNSSQKEVAHQSIFLNIVYTLIQYNLHINLYHNRGHFSENNVNSFINLFSEQNFLNDFIDKDIARKIIYYNNKIDNDTRKMLYSLYDKPQKLEIPEYLAKEDINMNHYKNLLNI